MWPDEVDRSLLQDDIIVLMASREIFFFCLIRNMKEDIDV